MAKKQKHEGHYFGFEEVDPAAKADKVKSVFDSVASSYDLMNDAMSLGIHRLWKNEFVQKLPLKPGAKILDVATGTGDIVYRMLEQCSEIEITATDINEAMLMEGKANLQNKGIIKQVDYKVVDAEKLPFKDHQFDLYTISFGLRNVTHIDQALKEANRVLKPGGQFFCLEFSHVKAPLLKQLYDFHSFNILPLLGELLAKDGQSYQYLAESIRQFPAAEALVKRMEDAGFRQSKFKRLSFGIVAIHSGWKI